MTQAVITAAAVTGGAIALAGGLTYAALSSQSQMFGRVLIAGRNPDEIALTYDDGPNDEVTERLLDIFSRHQVRVTFFLIGRFVRQRPQIARAIVDAGHLVGNHTMTHPWLAWQSERRIREELGGCNAVLEDVLGVGVRYFRAPHGARRPAVLRVAGEMGLVPVQWNVISSDWTGDGAELIAARTVAGIARNQNRGRGSNVVLHDGGQAGLGQPRQQTVEATEMLLQRYGGAGGMKFVTVDHWG
ncbi:MAG: polysaccharide deacetylase family protein [Acidobacteriota bacterium]|nr:polysaccharide deacetylase family protein [Acidobacteriota bacterium]